MWDSHPTKFTSIILSGNIIKISKISEDLHMSFKYPSIDFNFFSACMTTKLLGQQLLSNRLHWVRWPSYSSFTTQQFGYQNSSVTELHFIACMTSNSKHSAYSSIHYYCLLVPIWGSLEVVSNFVLNLLLISCFLAVLECIVKTKSSYFSSMYLD